MPPMQRGSLFLSLVLAMLTGSAIGQEEERAKGIALYRAGNHAEAITVLQKVVDADTANKVAWMYLGGALQNTGKKKEALEAFKKPSGGARLDEKFDSDVKIKSKPRAPYTDEARVSGEEGYVEVLVELRANGK